MENGQDREERCGEDADKYATRGKMGLMLERNVDDLYSDALAIAFFARRPRTHVGFVRDDRRDGEREM